MKAKIWKTFWDHEKEEKWLNEMAAKGFAMTGYSWCCYTFEDCAPSEYIYRIEMLEHNVNHPESRKYIQFMEENCVEHVDTYYTWAYFRKKATDGTFKIYSDLDSRIKHYQRISNLWLVLGYVELSVSFSLIGSVVSTLENGSRYMFVNVVPLGMLFSMSIMFLGLWWRYTKKIKHLKREREVQE
ncbi:MAG: DUF2812 domain-containing protein [Nitrososphaerota archaeon]|jgi:hypothetical protein|nr:DUF2812 domain-containing protein [Nitrososphaerota archaeon]